MFGIPEHLQVENLPPPNAFIQRQEAGVWKKVWSKIALVVFVPSKDTDLLHCAHSEANSKSETLMDGVTWIGKVGEEGG